MSIQLNDTSTCLFSTGDSKSEYIKCSFRNKPQDE